MIYILTRRPFSQNPTSHFSTCWGGGSVCDLVTNLNVLGLSYPMRPVTDQWHHMGSGDMGTPPSPVNEQTYRQTRMKTLPSRNFFGGW